MAVEPLYTRDNVHFAYQCNWSLTLFWKPVPQNHAWLAELRTLTEQDGIRILSCKQNTPTCTQFLTSTKPETPPQQISWSVKGRLQHLIRNQWPDAFARNFDLRSLGSTTRDKAEAYVAGQLMHHAADDSPLRAGFADLQFTDPEVDLSRPRFSNHARYWCNLHLVFVRNWRIAEEDPANVLAVREVIRKAAAKHQHLLSRVGILPDHVHLILGTHPREAPEEVALSYLNNLAYSQGMRPVFMQSCYVGTVGEYDLGAVGRGAE